MTNKNQNTTGFIARSNINPKLILCTDGEFHAEQFVGANSWGAKVFKTEKGAINAKGRTNIAVKVIAGVEIPAALPNAERVMQPELFISRRRDFRTFKFFNSSKSPDGYDEESQTSKSIFGTDEALEFSIKTYVDNGFNQENGFYIVAIYSDGRQVDFFISDEEFEARRRARMTPAALEAYDKAAEVMAFRKTINVGDILQQNYGEKHLCKVTFINQKTTNAYEDISFIYVSEQGGEFVQKHIDAGFGALQGAGAGGALPAHHFTVYKRGADMSPAQTEPTIGEIIDRLNELTVELAGKKIAENTASHKLYTSTDFHREVRSLTTDFLASVNLEHFTWRVLSIDDATEILSYDRPFVEGSETTRFMGQVEKVVYKPHDAVTREMTIADAVKAVHVSTIENNIKTAEDHIKELTASIENRREYIAAQNAARAELTATEKPAAMPVSELTKTEETVLDVIDGKSDYTELTLKGDPLTYKKGVSEAIASLKARNIIVKGDDNILVRTHESIEMQMKAYRAGMDVLPQSYIDYHARLAVQDLKELESLGYTVHNSFMTRSGWCDGMETMTAIVEKDGDLLKINWNDSNSKGSWFQVHKSGGSTLFNPSTRIKPSIS